MALCLVGWISRWLTAVVARRADDACPIRAREDGVVQREDNGKNWRPNAVRSIGSILALSWKIHCAGTRRCRPVNVDVQQTRVWPAVRLALHQVAKGLRSGSNPFLAALPSLHRCAAAALQQQQRPRWRRTPQRAPRGPRELMVAPSWPGVCSACPAVSIGSIDQVRVELFLLRHMQAVCRDLRSARLIVNVWPGAISD